MKKRRIPLVSELTYDSTTASLVEEYKDDRKFMLQELKKLKKKNPIVMKLIQDYCEKTEGKEFCKLVVGMLLVYRLLDSQAQADKMEADFGGTYEKS